jgi:4-amino-4-deoxy-L-arabinose transferase-like glycosyltransferase
VTRSRSSNALLLLGVFLAVFLAHFLFFANPPLARTEVHRALVAIDALDHGHWILTSILDEPYLRKPPFHPWTLAATAWLLDSREPWVFRLPSVLAAAGSATWLAFLALRWFGRTPALITGLAFLWLLPLWSQNRSAEIDGLNTFLALLAWAAILELAFHRTRYPWAWSALATLALAAAFLAKGPAALTVVLAAFIAPVLAGLGVRWLLRPAALIILPLAAALAASWVLAVESLTAAAPDQPQQAGLAELAARFATLLDPGHMLAVVTMPLVLTAFALPLSALAGLALLPSVRRTLPIRRRRRLDATLGSFAVANALVVLFLLENPRYGYILLPLITLPAAVILSRLLHHQLPDTLTRRLTTLRPLPLLIALIALIAVAVQVLPLSMPAAVTLMVIAAAFAAAAALRRRTLTTAAWLLLATAAIGSASTGYTLLKADQRATLSSANVAPQLAAHLAAPGDTVITGRLWNDKPGLFYYAHAQPRQRLDQALAGDPSPLASLYVLYPREAEQLEVAYPGRTETLATIDADTWRFVILRLLPPDADH